MASAMFNMINRLNDTFWTELETVEYNKRQGKAVKGVTLADIDAYAGGPAFISGIGAAARRRNKVGERDSVHLPLRGQVDRASFAIGRG